MRSYFRLFKNLLRWLFVDPQIVWLNLGFAGVCCASVWVFNYSELAIRTIGVITQFVGVGVVLRGLSGTARLFGRPGIGESFRRWLARRPRLKPSAQTISATGISSGSLFGHAYVIRGYVPDAPIETRVEALEANIKTAFEEIAYQSTEIGRRVDGVAAELSEERKARILEASKLQKLVEATQADGIHVSILGIGWTALGTILSSFSSEIASLIA